MRLPAAHAAHPRPLAIAVLLISGGIFSMAYRRAVLGIRSLFLQT